MNSNRTYFTFLLALIAVISLAAPPERLESDISHEHTQLFAEGNRYLEEIGRLARRYKLEKNVWPSSFSALIASLPDDKKASSLDWSRCKKLDLKQQPTVRL